ncbi:retinal rod rhodopsin-sensitive cGMP 3',5'-cyclic phosphodiesterase subunit gamma [Rhinopithecus roxellana]|uniref:retinal rod rhodopsin-sensitive cGMP 3',5'-cyclic phosphodiesterase subunit gamma n=1 Tax=Rhinopithecus roxellana TaxID=61622 RepID=UPI00123771A7|nr:retinal rod rhodopsin-sensitive cGMP 3',5'-cyclic phosphodiesterase subunit gamma [Rhinopithecus roxellana]
MASLSYRFLKRGTETPNQLTKQQDKCPGWHPAEEGRVLIAWTPETCPALDCSRRESRSQGCHGVSVSLAMNLEPSKAEFRSATRVVGGPVTPRKGPPKFKQRQTRQFKSKPPKKGVQGFGDDIPGMEGLGTDITVICPWEAFNHLELHELAQYGII